MKADDRKAALAAYKEQKIVAGIYAVRCVASGEVWIGQTPNVEKAQNRIWFTLSHGDNPCRSLQAAWTHHGAGTFTFEVVERLADEDSPYARKALLKERAVHWRSRLEAQAL